MRVVFATVFVGSGLVLAASVFGTTANQPEDGIVTVIDGSGKEHKLKAYKFTAGTKRLSWLASAPAEEKDKGADKDKEKVKAKKVPPEVGPEALELTEGKSVPQKKRVLTYVPLANIRSIEYAVKEPLVAVRVVKSEKEDDDEILTGWTNYSAVNTLVIDAIMDLGELGTGAVKFQLGANRGLQSIRFSSPKPIDPVPQGRVATIKQVAKNQPSIAAVDLQVLYLSGGLWHAFPTLHFRDTIKLDLAKVQKLTKVGTGTADFDVTLLSGKQTPLTLIERPRTPDGKSEMVLEGFVGRFSAGYRYFPMGTVGELEFESKEK